MITEIYVPRPSLVSFMKEAAEDFRKNRVEVIYGTVRFIEPDDVTFLAWAKQRYACVIFNLHVTHTPEGREHSAAAWRNEKSGMRARAAITMSANVERLPTQ